MGNGRDPLWQRILPIGPELWLRKLTGRRVADWRKALNGSILRLGGSASVYSIVLAGAGVACGLIGASDRIAAYPKATAVGPWDVAATMFAALGIDPETHATGRPFAITNGRAIRELYAG